MPFFPAWTSLNSDLATSGGWLERNEQQNLCSILTATPWGPSGPGKPVSPSGPRSPCQGEETADVSVGSDKGMTRGLTAQRQLEAAAHRLSWDPWLSTSTGLPLSITNTGREQTVFEQVLSGVILQHLCSPPFRTQQLAHRGAAQKIHWTEQGSITRLLIEVLFCYGASALIAAILCTLSIDLSPAAALNNTDDWSRRDMTG